MGVPTVQISVLTEGFRGLTFTNAGTMLDSGGELVYLRLPLRGGELPVHTHHQVTAWLVY